MVKFGDVFEHKNVYYVYLAIDVETGIMYAAKILTSNQTSQIIRFDQIRATKVGDAESVYCYVLLKTESLKDQAAHFHNPGHDDLLINPVDTLCEEDIRSIKKEIENSPAIPGVLKELTSDLSFE